MQEDRVIDKRYRVARVGLISNSFEIITDPSLVLYNDFLCGVIPVTKLGASLCERAPTAVTSHPFRSRVQCGEKLFLRSFQSSFYIIGQPFAVAGVSVA